MSDPSALFIYIFIHSIYFLFIYFINLFILLFFPISCHSRCFKHKDSTVQTNLQYPEDLIVVTAKLR